MHISDAILSADDNSARACVLAELYKLSVRPANDADSPLFFDDAFPAAARHRIFEWAELVSSSAVSNGDCATLALKVLNNFTWAQLKSNPLADISKLLPKSSIPRLASYFVTNKDEPISESRFLSTRLLFLLCCSPHFCQRLSDESCIPETQKIINALIDFPARSADEKARFDPVAEYLLKSLYALRETLGSAINLQSSCGQSLATLLRSSLGSAEAKGEAQPIITAILNLLSMVDGPCDWISVGDLEFLCSEILHPSLAARRDETSMAAVQCLTSIFKSPATCEGSRCEMKKMLFPANLDRSAPLSTGNTVTHMLIRDLKSESASSGGISSAYQLAIDNLFTTMFRDRNQELIKYIGYGNAMGYLIRKSKNNGPLNGIMDSSLLDCSSNLARDAEAEDKPIDPVTGQWIKDGLSTRSIASPTEEEMDEMIAVFEKLEKLGIHVTTKNPETE